MQEHKIPDHLLTNHEQNFRDLFSGLNTLRIESGQYMTMKAGITFFLGVLVTLVAAFMGQSYMQNQTFLEVRRQDQSTQSTYNTKVDSTLTKLTQEQSSQKSRLETFSQLQGEVRTKLKLTGE